MEALLTEVAERGWDAGLRERFVRSFDRTIGQAIVYYLARFWHLEGRELAQLLAIVERREGGSGETPEHPLSEVIEEAYVTIYRQVFQQKLILSYLRGKEQGCIKSDFAAYLRGAVRHRVLDCLRQRDRHRRVESAEEAEEEWEEKVPDQEPDWAKAVRARWWDRLVRCRSSGPEERKELHRVALALKGDAAERTRLCLACARMKVEGTEAEKEDSRMFLLYYLSNYGSRLRQSERVIPALEEITLERIRGLALSWEEIFKIFGRQSNPSRVREELRKRCEELA